MIGMHFGSVLSGLYAGNVNTDSKISIVGFETCACRGVKNDDFSMFGDLGLLRGWNANTDLTMSILPICPQGQKSRFFDVWRPWRGLL